MSELPIEVDDFVLGGGGLAGSSLVHHLSRYNQELGLKRRIMAVDQYAFRHNQGSSHDPLRIFRGAQFEALDFYYASESGLELRSDLQRQFREAIDPVMARIGRELIRYQGTDELMHQCGFIQIGVEGAGGGMHGVKDIMPPTLAFAEKHNIRHEMLRGPEIRKRFPGFVIPDDQLSSTVGYLEPEYGAMRIEACRYAHLALAQKKYGAELMPRTKVMEFQRCAVGDKTLITIARTDDRGNVLYQADGKTPAHQKSILAAKFFINAGPWAGKFTKEMGLPDGYFTPMYQTPLVVKSRNPGSFSVHNHPAFIRVGPDLSIYGVPEDLGGEFKVGDEKFVFLHPDNMNDEKLRYPSRAEMQPFADHIAPYFTQMSNDWHGVRCTYTETPDRQPYISRDEAIVIASACNGYGGKILETLEDEIARRAYGLPKRVLDIEQYGIPAYPPHMAHHANLIAH